MPSIDERVVAMSFENAKFEAGVAQTLASLGKLDTAIKNAGQSSNLGNIEKDANKVTLTAPMSALDKLRARLGNIGSGAAQGFGEIERDASKVSLSGASTAVDKLQGKLGQLNSGSTFSDIEKASDGVTLNGLSKAISSTANQFSTLQAAAAVALGNIASQAAMKGAAFGKSFGFGPINQGFEEYQTNLNSIQTILSNTQDSGGNLKTVNAALQELNTYSDKTIYNFSEMARNIGTFTAAGVHLKPATNAIKGIANLAALSGSNSQQASTAMYQLSQAIASGKVGLQDWNSVVNAGMGGAVFQKALAHTAETMHTLGGRVVEINKATGKMTIGGESFRESMMGGLGKPPPWLTSDVLTKTLSQFTGDMTDAELASQGFNAAQIKNIQNQAKAAQDAATQVKTLPQVFDVARETIGSGWAKTFQTIFGDFGESKKTFTALSNTVNGFINTTAKARNKVLDQWKSLGGRGVLLGGITQAFKDLGAILKPIHDAFRDVFPPQTGKSLFAMTVQFRDFMKALKPSPETVDLLRRTFAGFFAVVHIGFTIVKTVIGVLAQLVGFASKGAGGVLSLTASFGDLLVGFDKAISKGNIFANFFKGLPSALGGVADLLKSVGSAIKLIFGGDTGRSASDTATNLLHLQTAAGPLGGIFAAIVTALDSLHAALKRVANFLEPVFSDALETVKNFGSQVVDAIKSINFDDATKALTAGGLGGIFLLLKKQLGGDGGISLKFFDGVKGEVVTTLNALNGSLKAIQTNIKANTMLQIGVAVGVLAAGIFLLSKIDPKRLGSAMTAVAVGLGELVGALRLLGSVGGPASFAVMPLMAASLILVATAVDILVIAVKQFSKLSWPDLVKGLVGVGGALLAVGVGVRAIGPRVVVAGLALIPLAVGMNLLAVAVKMFSTMSWGDLVKGLVGMGVALGAIAVVIQGLGPSLLLTGPGLIAVAIGMTLLAGAVTTFASMDLLKMYQGILGVASALAAIGLSISLIPPTVALQAAGLAILAVALGGIAASIAVLGNMKIGTIVKGIAGIAAALVVLGIGLTAMSGTLVGSVALMAAATALAVLAPVLAILGHLEWGTIFKGLAAIALTLGTIAIVGLVAAPALLAIGVAMSAIGLGVITISSGIYILAKGISLLATSGQAGLTVLLTAMTALVAALPHMIITFVQGLVSIADEIAKVAPKVVGALVVILDSIVATIIRTAPRVAVAAGVIILSILDVLNKNAGPLIDAGWRLLEKLLQGIADNIGKVTLQVGAIVVNFLRAMTAQAPKMVAGGFAFLRSFLLGVANNIGKVISAGGDVIVKFLTGLATQLPRVVAAGGNALVQFLNGLAKQVPRSIAAGTRVIVGFLDGIGNAIPRIVAAAVRVITKFIDAIATQAPKLADAGFKAIIKFMNGVATAIRTNTQPLIDAGWNIASAIIDGMVRGFKNLGHKAISAVGDVISALPKKALKLLGIASPSKVFTEIGEYVVMGFSNGLASMSSVITRQVTNPLNKMIAENHDAKKFGSFLGKDFKIGLVGSKDDINKAFDDLRTNIKGEQDKLRETIKSDRDKLAKLQDAKHPNESAILSVWNSIQANEKTLKASKAATKDLFAGISDEHTKLLGLADDYDRLGTRLEAAKQALTDVIRQRDDAIQSYTDQYNALPDIDSTAKDQVKTYKQAIQDQIKATEKYMATLEKLRALGLDDATYKKLLSEGTKDQTFADQLVQGGKSSVDELNKLDAQLATDAAGLAKEAADNLYQAGIEAAQGLVDGLEAQQNDIKAVMEKIAGTMIEAIKTQLGIKSPSRVFAEIGKFSGQGMAQGLKATSRAVVNAAAGVGADAASALTQSLSHISDAVASEIDPDLTITPVLDLTQVQKDAKQLGDLTNVTPITAAASYGQASAISSDVTAAQQAQADAAATAAPVFQFEQNNYSPEALSDVEIYRKTKNQLSQVKGALGLTATA